MAIIVVCGEKGGTGKTTLATNLAAMRAATGRDVLLIDTDPQSNADFWQKARVEAGVLPRVGCVQKFGKALASEVRDQATRYQDIIIDAGGRDSAEMRAALVVAQVAVLPIQASQFDLWTVEKMAEIVETARGFNSDLRAFVVISRAPTNAAIQDAATARELIADEPALELATSVISDRVAFRRAAASGQSVAEYAASKDDKAALEMRALYDEVFGVIAE